jgi:hypothetical protein
MAAKKSAAAKKIATTGETAETAAARLPFVVGDCILVRTVTHLQLGRVRTIGHDFFTLDDGGWLADTGVRLGELLKTGQFNSATEYEKAPSWMLVGRGAICDVWPWSHALPTESR